MLPRTVASMMPQWTRPSYLAGKSSRPANKSDSRGEVTELNDQVQNSGQAHDANHASKHGREGPCCNSHASPGTFELRYSSLFAAYVEFANTRAVVHSHAPAVRLRRSVLRIRRKPKFSTSGHGLSVDDRYMA